MHTDLVLPSKQNKKLVCLNVQGCNDPAKRECVGRLKRMEEVCERMEGSLAKTDVCEDECR